MPLFEKYDSVEHVPVPAEPEVNEETRPWGTFRIIEEGVFEEDGSKYKIKELIVNPGGILSLQLHEHRTEVWTVIKGECLAQKNTVQRSLRAGDSIRILPNEMHRINNKEEEACHLIEVQVGEYVGEDDIVRFEDKYNRE